jgi:hypothetical protein
LSRRRVSIAGVACAIGLFAGSLAVPAAAFAGPTDTALVSVTPSQCTPTVHPATEPFTGAEVKAVFAQTVSGSTVYVGGTFDTVTERAGCGSAGRALTRHNIFAYNLATGAVSDTFAPATDGPVRSMMMSATGTLVYACGNFSTAAGQARKGLAKFGLDGALNSFDAHLNGQCFDTALSGGYLYVGGTFTYPHPGLTVVSQTSGARMAYDTVTLSGSATSSTASPKVQRLGASPDRKTLIVEGNFGKANGLSHPQAVMISTGTTATVAAWRAPLLDKACSTQYPGYLRVVSWSPTGTWFVLAGTGGAHHDTLCDAAARFDFQPSNSAQAPTWIQYTGGDSIFGGVVTGAAVYLGGHFHWADNPPIWPQIHSDTCNGNGITGGMWAGYNCKGPNAVDRPGIMAVDVNTGKALPWNPTRSLLVGARSLVVVPPTTTSAGGLLVGSDGPYLGCATPNGVDCTGVTSSYVGGEGFLPSS